MPTPPWTRFGRIGPASGPKNLEHPNPRSSDRSKSGYPNGTTGYGSTKGGLRRRSGGGVRAVSTAWFRPPPGRNARRSRTPPDAAAGGGDAAAVAAVAAVAPATPPVAPAETRNRTSHVVASGSARRSPAASRANQPNRGRGSNPGRSVRRARGNDRLNLARIAGRPPRPLPMARPDQGRRARATATPTAGAAAGDAVAVRGPTARRGVRGRAARDRLHRLELNLPAPYPE